MLISKETLETHFSLIRLLNFAAAPDHFGLHKGQKALCVASFSSEDQGQPYLFAESDTHLRKRLLVFESGHEVTKKRVAFEIETLLCRDIQTCRSCCHHTRQPDLQIYSSLMGCLWKPD